MDTKNLNLKYTAEEINENISKLAEKINEIYKNKEPIFIGCLNGVFMFMSDLMKKIKLKCRIDFIKVSSYIANV